MTDAQPAAPFPDPVRTAAEAAWIERQAERIRTPCAEGTITWHQWGRADGAPVLLLHGGSGSWNHWVRNLGALVRAGRRVLVPDVPGFGDSGTPGGDDADAAAPWLRHGLADLLGDTPLDLVGFSFGALVGSFLAEAEPARVRRFVLVGAPALSGERLAPLPLRPWERYPAGERRDAAHRHNLATLMLSDPAAADDLAVALHGAHLPRDRLRRRRLMLTDAIARRLPAMPFPVQGIWGADDVLYRGRQALVARVLATAPRFAGLVFVPGAGHWVQYEQAAAFDAHLAQALGHAPAD